MSLAVFTSAIYRSRACVLGLRPHAYMRSHGDSYSGIGLAPVHVWCHATTYLPPPAGSLASQERINRSAACSIHACGICGSDGDCWLVFPSAANSTAETCGSIVLCLVGLRLGDSPLVELNHGVIQLPRAQARPAQERDKKLAESSWNLLIENI
jgi:hypothetical protein